MSGRQLKWIVLIALPLLASCTQLRDGAYKATRDVERESQIAAKKISTYMEIRPMQEDKPIPPVPPIYCYRVLQDIACYNQPLPGAEGRLIGKQGDGVTSFTKPVYVATDADATDLRPSPEVKLEQVTPIYIPPVPAVAGEKK